MTSARSPMVSVPASVTGLLKTPTPVGLQWNFPSHTGVGSDTERAYARSDLFERRRELMQKWADYLTSTG